MLRRAADIGIDARVVSGYRDPKEQAKEYAKGRTVPGKIVTKAPPGYSWHQFGHAFDIGVFRQDLKQSYVQTFEDGKYYPERELLYKLLGPVAERIGLIWGGRWKTPDNPHYQLKGIPVTPTDEWRRKIGL